MSAPFCPVDQDVDFTDLFCGAGGSSKGLTEAGLRLVVAANHAKVPIATHEANFPDARHECTDISQYDMRGLPRTRVLWASPICTELSPAGGKRRRPKGQLDWLEEEGHVAKETMERTRATFHDVIRAAEVHRYDAVIVENVPAAADWELWDWWLSGMVLLGYNYQLVSVSSAHVGGEDNPWAPQWRDRIYVVFTRAGIPLPDVDPKPTAWCWVCEKIVQGYQSWKRPERPRIGKYGPRNQYVYRCPSMDCRHSAVEPFVLPAAAAIDWSDLGTRIGDRKKTKAKPEGLAPATMRRIRAGRDLYAQPMTVAVGGNTWERPGSGYIRAWPAAEMPLNVRTGTPGDALATPPPFLTLLRSGRIRNLDPATEPLAGIMASGSNHGLVVPIGGYNRTSEMTTTGEPFRTRVVRDVEALAVPPFVLKNYGGYCEPRHNVEPVGAPLSAVTARDHHALVVPFRRGHATTTGEPLHTMATRDSAALVHPEDDDVADWLLRMLKPREHCRAQRIPDSYIMTGNPGEQTMQAGNAVSVNVAHWLGRAIVAVLQ